MSTTIERKTCAAPDGVMIVYSAAGAGEPALLFIHGGLAERSFYDAQLKAFVSDPTSRGKILDTGLWRYTRHPNYFGEVTQWWGVWLIALSAPHGWVAVVSPLTITLLLLFVSGVPMLEKKMAENPGWAEYAAKTSVFVPLPPKKG